MKKTPIVIALLGSFALCHSFNASALQTNTFNQNEFLTQQETSQPRSFLHKTQLRHHKMGLKTTFNLTW